MDKSASLPMRSGYHRTPANNNSKAPPHFAVTENIEGVGDVPMISTENIRVRRLVGIISKVISDTLEAYPKGYKPASFSIEFVDLPGDLETEVEASKPFKVPKGSEHIAEYFGNRGLRHLELIPDKISSIDEVHSDLMALTEWEITFHGVVEILLKRWFRQSQVYFQDRQVATLVQFLLDETQRKKVLNMLKSFEFGASNPYF